MQRFKRSRVVVSLVALVAMLGIFNPATASADPLPGGGSVAISQSADMCTATIAVRGTTGTTTVEALGYITGVSSVLVKDVTGVNPTLTVQVSRGYTTDLMVEVVRSNKVVWSGEVRASCGVNVYTTPGDHYVNGREWRTTCEKYSTTITRCQTLIKSGGTYVFNNLTYLPSPRSAWTTNPIGGYGKVGYKGTWDSGRWRVECDTAATGRNACRSYIKSGGVWVFNNQVLFS